MTQSITRPQIDLVFDDVLSDDDCQKLIDIGNEFGFTPGTLSIQEEKLDADDLYVDTSIRNCLQAPIDTPPDFFLKDKLFTVLKQARNMYQFDVRGITDLQLIKYDVGSYFKRHIDIGMYESGAQRKITFIIQLSDPNDYTGGDLVLHTNPEATVMPRDKGSVIVFPAFFLHEVTPLLTGQRYSLTGWCYGPPFK